MVAQPEKHLKRSRCYSQRSQLSPFLWCQLKVEDTQVFLVVLRHDEADTVPRPRVAAPPNEAPPAPPTCRGVSPFDKNMHKIDK
jgi:hypothetical protein